MTVSHALRLSALAGLAAAAAFARSAQPLEISYESVWMGNGSPVTQLKPFLVEIQNNGPDQRGYVGSICTAGQIRVPVELPRGARKSVPLYAPAGVSSYDLRIVYDFPSGSGTIPVNYSPPSGVAVGTITDGPGAASIVQKQASPPSTNARRNGASHAQVEESLARPQKAPENPLAYVGLGMVVLGEGAERISDKAVQAIKDYVLLGGRLGFLGGALTPHLQDPRWSGWLPISKLAAGRRMSPYEWGLVDGQEIGWLTAAAAPDASVEHAGGAASQWRCSRGLGAVIVFAANFSDRPLREAGIGERELQRVIEAEDSRLAWMGALFSQGSDRLDFPGLTNRLDSLVGAASSFGTYSPAVPAMRSGRVPYRVQEVDPFRIEPPNPWVVFGILALYWVILIPVHFGVLAKLGRQNAAWVTGPLIAVGFSVVFYSFASSLVGAHEARSQEGVIVAQAGVAGGMYHGRESLFFPKGGRYNLGLEGVQGIWSQSQSPDGRGGDDGMEDLVDLGDVQAPRYSVPNLGFRDFAIAQRVDLGGGLTAEIERRKGREPSAVVKVANRTPYAIVGAQLHCDIRATVVGSLPPGSERSIVVLPGRSLLSRNSRPALYLSGQIQGVPIGSRRATVTAANDQVTLFAGLGVFPGDGQK